MKTRRQFKVRSGGSRFQIGGPAGAFIVPVSATVHRHAVDGLLLATIISGLFMIGAGYLRLGNIKFIPHSVSGRGARRVA